jgi:hypothetical protein
MAFPRCIVHGRELLLIQDIRPDPNLQQDLHARYISFARSMEEWGPGIKLVDLVQIRAVVF